MFLKTTFTFFYIKYIQNNWQNWYIYINIFWSLFWNIFKSIFCNHGVTSKRLSILLLFDYIIKFNNQSSVYLEQNSYVKASNIKHEYIYSKVAKHDFYYKKGNFLSTESTDSNESVHLREKWCQKRKTDSLCVWLFHTT